MELQQTLLNIRILRAQLRETSVDNLAKIKENINILLEEHIEEEEAEKLLQEEKKEDMQKAKKSIEDLGLTLEDVAKYFNISTEPKEDKRSARKGVKMEPKYKYEDPDNPEITLYWTGQGKIPNKMLRRMKMDLRNDKEFYLIDPD